MVWHGLPLGQIQDETVNYKVDIIAYGYLTHIHEIYHAG